MIVLQIYTPNNYVNVRYFQCRHINFVKFNFKYDIIDKIVGICSEQMDVQLNYFVRCTLKKQQFVRVLASVHPVQDLIESPPRSQSLGQEQHFLTPLSLLYLKKQYKSLHCCRKPST